MAVTQGDCSNTHALMETLRLRGIRTIPFAYPYDRDADTLRREIGILADALGSSIADAERCAAEIEPLRGKLDALDELTWKDDRVTGGENHIFLVSSSDFGGDRERFERDLDHLLATAMKRPPARGRVRLGYIGVPPIIDDLHDAVESMGARIVFNEVQRQFSMPVRGAGIVNHILPTLPYDIFTVTTPFCLRSNTGHPRIIIRAELLHVRSDLSSGRTPVPFSQEGYSGPHRRADPHASPGVRGTP